MKPFVSLINSPLVYNLIQFLLAWTGSRVISDKLKKYISFKPGDLILDVGCGTGKYASLFKKANYFGIDTSDEYIKYAHKKYPFGKFILMDATKLNFPGNHFDYVFSVSTFHHLSDNQVNESLSEMKRVCRDGGSVYVIDNVYPSKINFIGYFLFKLDRGRNQRTFDEMSNLLKRHSFAVVDPYISKGFPYRYTIFRYKK